MGSQTLFVTVTGCFSQLQRLFHIPIAVWDVTFVVWDITIAVRRSSDADFHSPIAVRRSPDGDSHSPNGVRCSPDAESRSPAAVWCSSDGDLIRQTMIARRLESCRDIVNARRATILFETPENSLRGCRPAALLGIRGPVVGFSLRQAVQDCTKKLPSLIRLPGAPPVRCAKGSSTANVRTPRETSGAWRNKSGRGKSARPPASIP